MENFMISLNVVLPLFLLMMLGFLFRRFKFVNDSFLKQCNAMLFRVFLPVLVFYSLYHSDIRDVFDWRLLLFGGVGIALYYIALRCILPKFIKDFSICSTMIQGSFRGNCLIFGIPIATALYGPTGVGPTALIAAVMVPMFNVLSVMVFSNDKKNLKAQGKSILTNPLTIGVALGLLCVLTNIHLPKAVESAVSSVANVAAPFSLIILGASFRFLIPKTKIKALFGAVSLKLMVEPLLFLTIGYLCFGFQGSLFVALLAAFATPSSSTSFIVAGEMGGDSELAAQIVVFSSLVSILTIFLIIFFSINMGIL